MMQKKKYFKLIKMIINRMKQGRVKLLDKIQLMEI